MLQPPLKCQHPASGLPGLHATGALLLPPLPLCQADYETLSFLFVTTVPTPPFHRALRTSAAGSRPRPHCPASSCLSQGHTVTCPWPLLPFVPRAGKRSLPVAEEGYRIQ